MINLSVSLIMKNFFLKKDLSFVGKYLEENPSPNHSKAMELCEKELKNKTSILWQNTDWVIRGMV